MPSNKKIASVAKECVACGCCQKTCVLKAILVHKGVRAIVDSKLCTGCGRCAKACPAGVIELIQKGVRVHEEAMV